MTEGNRDANPKYLMKSIEPAKAISSVIYHPCPDELYMSKKWQKIFTLDELQKVVFFNII